MSPRHANSFYHWSLTGTLAGALLLGGSVLSHAGPFTLTPKSKGTAPAQTEMQKQLAKRRAANLEAAISDDENPLAAGDPAAEAETRVAQSAKKIKLSFLESSWASVLNSYAEQAGVELVAEQGLLPRDRFTRRDRSYYTQADALEILNRELHRYDLKLVPKGKKLQLQDIHKTAPNYRRPIINSEGMTVSHELPPSSIKPAFADRKQPQRIGDVVTADAREIPITGETDSRQNRIQLTGGTSQAADQDPRKATLLPVPIRHLKSKQLANVLYVAFQKNCELINNGPDSLPSIRVYEPVSPTKQVVGKIALAAPARTERFTLAMDHEQSQLTIQAPAATARVLADMIRKLDTPLDAGQNVQLFASEHQDQVEKITEMVQNQLTRMSRAKRLAPPHQQGRCPPGRSANRGSGGAGCRSSSARESG